VQLIANNKELEKITLNNSNNWKAVIDELPFNENGEQIDYEVKEISKPEGYTTNIVEKGGLYEITNTHIPEIVTAKVEKLWIDENNLDGVRPEEVEVVLLKNGKATEQSLILSEKNNWKGEIENLPKYEEGEKIQYNFVLKESISEYTTTYEQNENITKITNVHKIPKVNLTVEKVWNDKNNADGIRPQTVEIGFYVDGIQQQVLELNELNDWTITMSNLRQFINNKPVTYEFVELTNLDGYTTETIVKDNKTIITNTHIPETTIAKVEKVWIDNNNSDGLRPEEVEVVLIKNGKATEQSLILSEKNNWQGEIENLIKKENGKEIQYSFVLKENIPEYSTTYEQNENLTKITSVHDSMKTEASVKKVWEDNNSSKRPESIIVILCKDGKATEKQVLLSEKNNWQATISDLLKYEKGKEIEYSFIEKEIPKGYTNKTETKEGITVITNTLERELINNPDTEDEPDKPMKEPEETTKETITEKPNKNVEKTDANASPVKTGDTTGIIILLLLCVVSGIGLYRKK